MKMIRAGIVGLMLVAVVIAQSPSLRDQVIAKNGNVLVQVNADPLDTPFAQVLTDTDVIVRGRVGRETSRLSPDERDVLTTYEVSNPSVAFSAVQPKPLRPGETPRPITITLPGGTARIGLFSATVIYVHGPKLTSGMEIIALLHDRGGEYVPAGGDAILEISNRHVTRSMASQPELRKFEGAAADEFVNEIVALRKTVRR